MSVPNQKVIINHCNKKSNPEKGEYVSVFIRREFWEAHKKLGNAHVLWMFIAQNIDGYKFELSVEAFQEETGASPASYYRYVKKLIETGYLVQNKKQKNLYDFYASLNDVPKEEYLATGFIF